MNDKYLTIEQLKNIPNGARVIEARFHKNSDNITYRKAVIKPGVSQYGHGIHLDYELSRNGVASCSTWYLRCAIDDHTIQQIGNPAIRILLDESADNCTYSYGAKPISE